MVALVTASYAAGLACAIVAVIHGQRHAAAGACWRARDMPLSITQHVTAVFRDARRTTSQWDKHIARRNFIRRLGLPKETNYGRRSLVETTMGRNKAIIGPSHARTQSALPAHRSGGRRGCYQMHAIRRTAKLRPPLAKRFRRLPWEGLLSSAPVSVNTL